MPLVSAIRLDDLTLGYDRHPAVHHLSGEIASGSLTAIVGPNGAGKSTLLKGIAGALSPLEGGISLARGQAPRLSAAIGRSRPLLPDPCLRPRRHGPVERRRHLRPHRLGSRASVEAAIAAVGLTGFERRPIGTLSGGQMQRALFARLLLQDADIILLDEPFTAIDARTTADLLALVQRWHGESRTVVAVLHDIETVRRAFPQTLLLAREAVAWGATDEVLTAANLLKARRMVEAFDSHAAPCERDAA